MNKIKDSLRFYRMLCIAHRLRKFGFENQINDLDNEELGQLAVLVYPHQKAAIEREIAERIAAKETTHATC
jgi:hypothetical protein